ncbi:MAG: type II secretion system F family protein [Chloroflexi bacterium]|nr:type II secretion system F family protein [Chloroflexota bacterium]
MDFHYIAYTEDKRLVKGKLSATNEEAAINLLSYGNYQVVSLKSFTPFFNMENLLARFTRVRLREIIMFSRQLALLLESGTDIVISLELLQSQATNRTLIKVIGEVASDIRGGSSLSAALGKHPRAFPEIYHRSIAAGEEGGNLEIVLRQMADYMERAVITEKKIKNALTYPIIVAIVAFLVIGILVTFVLPTFTSLYTAFGAELPLSTRMLMGMTDWLGKYGVYLFMVIAVVAGLGYVYVKTPRGKYQWDTLSLRLPVFGRISLLSQLARCCRTMSLLFRVGLPLPEIINMTIHGNKNKAMVEALTGVQHDLIRGEGLSKPMSKNSLFLPLMVQMIGVGEETGNLDNTLATVAESYEVEADDRTTTAVGLIQPAMMVIIAVFVGFIAISMVSAMYSIYGQMG